MNQSLSHHMESLHSFAGASEESRGIIARIAAVAESLTGDRPVDGRSETIPSLTWEGNYIYARPGKGRKRTVDLYFYVDDCEQKVLAERLGKIPKNSGISPFIQVSEDDSDELLEFVIGAAVRRYRRKLAR